MTHEEIKIKCLEFAITITPQLGDPEKTAKRLYDWITDNYQIYRPGLKEGVTKTIEPSNACHP